MLPETDTGIDYLPSAVIRVPIKIRPIVQDKTSMICHACGSKQAHYFLYAGDSRVGSQHYSPSAAFKAAVALTVKQPKKYQFRGHYYEATAESKSPDL